MANESPIFIFNDNTVIIGNACINLDSIDSLIKFISKSLRDSG